MLPPGVTTVDVVPLGDSTAEMPLGGVGGVWRVDAPLGGRVVMVVEVEEEAPVVGTLGQRQWRPRTCQALDVELLPRWDGPSSRPWFMSVYCR